MIQNLIFGAYLLMSEFLAEVSEPLKTSYPVSQSHFRSFYNAVSFKKLYSLYELQLIQHCKNKLLQHSLKPYSL